MGDRRCAFAVAVCLASATATPAVAETEESEVKRLVYMAGGGVELEPNAMGLVTLGYGWGTQVVETNEPTGVGDLFTPAHRTMRRLLFVAISGRQSGDESHVIGSFGRARSEHVYRSIHHVGIDVRVAPDLLVGINATASVALVVGVFATLSVYVYPSYEGSLGFGIHFGGT